MVTTRYVSRIVAFGGRPATLSEDEVTSIKKVVDSGRKCGPHEFVQVGEQVLVVQGPLTGLVGIVARASGGTRVIVSAQLLMRSIFVEVDAAELSPISAGRGRACATFAA